MELLALKTAIKDLATDFGIAAVRFTTAAEPKEFPYLAKWISAERYGTMRYFARHQVRYADLAQLLPNVKTVICCQMNYSLTAPQMIASFANLPDYTQRFMVQLTNYAAAIGKLIKEETGEDWHFRCCAGNAPLMEKALAVQAGLGWRGKNSLVVNVQRGSSFFLGEILCDIAVPPDLPISNRCGKCERCLKICPTGALTAYRLEVTRCLAYLTCEHRGEIPLNLRPALRQNLFGCDLCQVVCPWNHKWQQHDIINALITPGIDGLIAAFCWSKKQFIQHVHGTPIERLGYERWQRNLAIILGNQDEKKQEIYKVLQKALETATPLVREHILWSMERIRGSYTKNVKM